MATVHTVTQGEHLSRIARQYGFTDYRSIWDRPENAKLKSARQNPNVLLPGDQLFIPDRELREEPRHTDLRHRFQVTRRKLKLAIVLEDMYERPIAVAPYELRIEGDTRSLTTSGDGRLEREIAPDAESASIVVRDAQTPASNSAIPVKIGHLDPVDHVSGQAARLNNLGYFPPVDGTDAEALRSAVEEFQCDHGLAVDGKCGPATQAKLKQVHGC